VKYGQRLTLASNHVNHITRSLQQDQLKRSEAHVCMHMYVCWELNGNDSH
jgi:hypothetical protein